MCTDAIREIFMASQKILSHFNIYIAKIFLYLIFHFRILCLCCYRTGIICFLFAKNNVICMNQILFVPSHIYFIGETFHAHYLSTFIRNTKFIRHIMRNHFQKFNGFSHICTFQQVTYDCISWNSISSSSIIDILP